MEIAMFKRTDEKKAAAKAKRQEFRKKVALKLNPLKEWAEQAVLDAAREHADKAGADRADAALDALAQRIDDAIEPENPILEAVTDGAISAGRIILESIIEAAYQRLHSQGRA